MNDNIINLPDLELLSKEETRFYIEAAQNGDKTALDKLVKHNLKLVLKVTYRFKNSGYDLQDLFQIGVIGLIKAIKNFDLTRNLRLSTYAVAKILGEIRLHLRDDSIIKVSRSLKKTARVIKKSEEELGKKLNRSPTIGELAEKTGISRNKIVQALEADRGPASIYQPINPENGADLFLIDKLREKKEKSSLESTEKISLIESIRELDPRSRKIIYYRYFKDMTQEQIAEKIGVSQVQISRLEKKILNKLKEAL